MDEFLILAGGFFGGVLAVTFVQTLLARKHSRELKTNAEMWRQLFDTSPDGMVIADRRGIILHVNKKAETVFGYTRDELLGASVEILVPGKLRERHRNDREAYNATPVARPMDTGRELHARRKDGSEFPVEIELTPLQSAENGLVIAALVVDITARRQAEEALRDSEARFRSAFEHGPIGVTLLGQDGRMVKPNPELCRMFGYSEAELVQMTPLEITHPEDLPVSTNLMKDIFKDEKDDPSIKKLVKRYIKKNGETMWGSLSVSVIRDREGHPLYAISMVEDITERKRAEADLRLGNEIIAKMQGALYLVRASDGVVVYANPSFEKMFGYSTGEIIGKQVATLNAPTAKPPEKVAEEIVAELTRCGQWRGEVLALRKDGSAFWSSVVVSAFDHPGFGKVWVSILQDITARKQTEQILTEQAALLDLAHDAIFVSDLENRIKFWNRGAKDMYGWSAEEAFGRVASELLHTRFPSSFDEIKAKLQKQGEWEGELEHTRRDGKTMIVASHWSVQRNESGEPTSVLEINRDITQRKRAEEQLRDLTERLSLATATASIGIWDLDLRTDQVVWDSTTFEIFGIPSVVPMPRAEVTQWIHPDDLPAVRAAAQLAIQGKTQESVEFRIIRPDGSVRYISTAEGPVLDERGNVVRLVGTAVDITERKEMESQIEASARLSALGMMAGGVAHEINNPLAIIHGSALDLLRRMKEQDSVPLEIARRNGERIVQTANRIAKIIKSMRHLAREGSHDKVRPTPVARIVEETLEVCRERFKNHGVNLLLSNLDPALSISCRQVQIEQVLLNLLQNAFDAVAEQRGEKWVRLAVFARDGAAEFCVTDSGPGIPLELKTKIMEPFFTTKDVGKGTGLGLSVSRKIVEDHGGTLELREENGHPCFSFRLPLSSHKELYAA
jgi:PAS domain S-box-containing protein